MSAGGSNALAGRDDVWFQLDGLLDRARGGELPVVAIQEIPSSTSTITDRTQFVFGYMQSSVGVNQVAGRDSPYDFIRVETIQIKEIV